MLNADFQHIFRRPRSTKGRGGVTDLGLSLKNVFYSLYIQSEHQGIFWVSN